MPISDAAPHKGLRSSRVYNTYHGKTGSSRLGGINVLKHPKGRKAQGKHKGRAPKHSRGMAKGRRY